jgi:hypothetical protein
LVVGFVAGVLVLGFPYWLIFLPAVLGVLALVPGAIALVAVVVLVARDVVRIRAMKKSRERQHLLRSDRHLRST